MKQGLHIEEICAKLLCRWNQGSQLIGSIKTAARLMTPTDRGSAVSRWGIMRNPPSRWVFCRAFPEMEPY